MRLLDYSINPIGNYFASRGGTGSGTVEYSVGQNISAARSGSITVAGLTFNISQDSGCSYVVTPSSQSFTASGGTGSFTVSAGTGCTWTASTVDSWITITSGSSGTGPGSVNYSVAANPGSPRSGTITVAGVPRTISQSGGAGNCQVSNFAGSGAASYGEGTANNSKWNSPNAGVVAKDPQTGRYSLFIADTENHRIRLVYLSDVTIVVERTVPGQASQQLSRLATAGKARRVNQDMTLEEVEYVFYVESQPGLWVDQDG